MVIVGHHEGEGTIWVSIYDLSFIERIEIQASLHLKFCPSLEGTNYLYDHCPLSLSIARIFRINGYFRALGL